MEMSAQLPVITSSNSKSAPEKRRGRPRKLRGNERLLIWSSYGLFCHSDAEFWPRSVADVEAPSRARLAHRRKTPAAIERVLVKPRGSSSQGVTMDITLYGIANCD